MVDRFLVWFAAGVVAVGVSAGMVTGTGLAVADDGSSSGGAGGSTSQSSNSTPDGQDSPGAGGAGPGDPSTDPSGLDNDDAEGPDTTDPDASEPDNQAGDAGDQTDSDDEGATDDEGTDEGTADEDVATDEDTDADEDTTTGKEVTSNSGSDAAHRSSAAVTTKPTTVLDHDTTLGGPAEDTDKDLDKVAEGEKNATDSAEESFTVARTSVVLDSPTELAASATATAPSLTRLLDLVGTIVFNLYAVATRLVGGPPMLPPNSTVAVRRSTLVLECGCEEGDTIEVPADWYIPAGAEEDPPDRMIYLQHGFLAAGPWYSHTAAALAEQTGSIVVAPSITSNFLAADACWLGAAPMHQAIAGLFDDGNTALADSAEAAGYSGAVPDRVVLMGHSLGGGAVIGTAGYMADNGTLDRLAGVVLLDGVPLTDTATASLEKVPDDIPIYQLAAPEYFWNQFGVGSDALLAARPDTFVGVTLVGGSHVDTMRGGNPLIQFSQQLVSGFSKPQNVAAARILMVGWVNDMFAGDQATGGYLNPGEEFALDTPSGEATLVALPNSLTKPFLFNFLQPFVSLGDNFFTFEPTCVAESIGTASAGTCGESIAA